MARAKPRADGALNVPLPVGATHFPAEAGAPPELFPPGISIRSRRGVQIDFAYDGRRCTETLAGEPTTKLVREAVTKRAAVLRDIEYNRFSYEAAFPDSRKVQKAAREAAATAPVVSTVRMRTLLDDFLTIYKQENPSATNTLATHAQAVRSSLAPVFSDMRPDEVTQAFLIEFRDQLRKSEFRGQLRKKPLSDKRISNVLTPLRGALALARERGLIHDNPFERMRPTTRRRGASVALGPDGQPSFDEPLPSSLDPKYEDAAKQADPLDHHERAGVLDAMAGQIRNYFLFAFWSGLRTGELIALRWCDIDWKKNQVCVRLSWSKASFTKTKSKRARWVELNEPARQALLAQKDITSTAGRWVFHNPKTNDRWQNSERVRQHWIAALKTAGVRYRKPYQTRHTYASAMVSAGEIPEWVADQMGHLDTRMVAEVYAKWVQRPDMTPGESAAKIYKAEWSRAASWADHVNVMPAGVDDAAAGAGAEDDEEDDDEEDDEDL